MTTTFTLAGELHMHDDVTPLIDSAVRIEAGVLVDTVEHVVFATGASAVTDGDGKFSLPLVAGDDLVYKIRSLDRPPAFDDVFFSGDRTAGELVNLDSVVAVDPNGILPGLYLDIIAARDAAQGYAAAAAGSVSLVAWAPATVYTTGQVRQAPDGTTISRNTGGTSRATFDATEALAWTAVAGKAGTLLQLTLAATYATLPVTGQHPLTGYFHAEAYGDKTLKTSNVNLAIAAAKAVGGTVYMRAGNWTCDEVINMSSINAGGGPYSANVVRLLGAGHQVTKVTGGEAGFGFLEVVDSPRAVIEGINFQQSTAGLVYGILAGRNSTDRSAPSLVLRDVYVTGNYSLSAFYSINIEQAHYVDCIFWANSSAACILARDQVGRTAVTAKWTAISSTAGYGGGNGIIRMDRVQCVTTRNLTNGPTDYPLVVEYAQTLVIDSLYTLSGGAHLIVLDKRIDELSIRGLQQEFWDTGSVAGATEPYGIYLKNTVTGAESRIARVSIEASSLYSIFGEDNVKLSGLHIKSSGFRATTKSFNVNLWSADVVEVPVGGGNYTQVSTSEQATPTYNRRDGTPLTIWTPMGVLRAAQVLDFPSVASGGVQSLTVTVTGARSGDPVTVNVNPGGLTTGIVLTAGVSANDTVTVKAQNVTAGAIDPAAVTVIVTVLRFA